FWIDSPSYLGLATLASVVVYFTAHLVDSRKTWIVWLDAVALAVAVTVGFGVTQSMGHSGPIIIVMSIITGTLGGLMRDVVANEVPLVLKQGEIYATACMSGAVAGLVVLFLDWPLYIAMVSTAVVTFILRAGSITLGWKLPVYKSQPKRDSDHLLK
ncbi:MAG: TRIC cation channel family protein, partial [Hyphomicrobiales bacterium]